MVSGVRIYPKNYIFTESHDTSYETIYVVHDVSCHCHYNCVGKFYLKNIEID